MCEVGMIYIQKHFDANNNTNKCTLAPLPQLIRRLTDEYVRALGNENESFNFAISPGFIGSKVQNNELYSLYKKVFLTNNAVNGFWFLRDMNSTLKGMKIRDAAKNDPFFYPDVFSRDYLIDKQPTIQKTVNCKELELGVTRYNGRGVFSDHRKMVFFYVSDAATIHDLKDRLNTVINTPNMEPMVYFAAIGSSNISIPTYHNGNKDEADVILFRDNIDGQTPNLIRNFVIEQEATFPDRSDITATWQYDRHDRVLEKMFLKTLNAIS